MALNALEIAGLAAGGFVLYEILDVTHAVAYRDTIRQMEEGTISPEIAQGLFENSYPDGMLKPVGVLSTLAWMDCRRKLKAYETR
jgi:hypothetical protein